MISKDHVTLKIQLSITVIKLHFKTYQNRKQLNDILLFLLYFCQINVVLGSSSFKNIENSNYSYLKGAVHTKKMAFYFIFFKLTHF